MHDLLRIGISKTKNELLISFGEELSCEKIKHPFDAYILSNITPKEVEDLKEDYLNEGSSVVITVKGYEIGITSNHPITSADTESYAALLAELSAYGLTYVDMGLQSGWVMGYMDIKKVGAKDKHTCDIIADILMKIYGKVCF